MSSEEAKEKEKEKDPAIRFYYNSEGRGTSWYALTPDQQAKWRRRYENAQRTSRRTLNRIKNQGARSPRHG